MSAICCRVLVCALCLLLFLPIMLSSLGVCRGLVSVMQGVKGDDGGGDAEVASAGDWK